MGSSPSAMCVTASLLCWKVGRLPLYPNTKPNIIQVFFTLALAFTLSLFLPCPHLSHLSFIRSFIHRVVFIAMCCVVM